MSRNYFHRMHTKQIAAWFALFAIALIIIAPLISVFLQKSTMKMMPGMMHHHAPMVDSHHASHKTVPMPDELTDACGYCGLLAHVPGLLPSLAGLICALMLRLRLQPPQPVTHQRYFSPWLYPHTRAPPQMITFTY